jgi:hypothetical protein
MLSKSTPVDRSTVPGTEFRQWTQTNATNSERTDAPTFFTKNIFLQKAHTTGTWYPAYLDGWLAVPRNRYLITVRTLTDRHERES